MKIAALDLGTNSFLCLIAEIDKGRIAKIISDQSTIVRLGQGVDKTGRLHPEALQRADQCLARYAKDIREAKVERVVAVATSAARDAENAKEFQEILGKHNIPFEVISGQKEAELTFLGATYDRAEKKGLAVIDVGGGSTEIIVQSNFGDFFSQSLQLGAVRATEKWINKHPISTEDMDNLHEYVHEQIQEFYESAIASRSIVIDELIGVAGTPTTLAAMTLEEEFSVTKVEGFTLYKKVLREWLQKLAAMSVEERCQLTGLERGRADIIVSGTMILLETLNVFGLDSMSVSTKGVRFGLALKGAEVE